MLFAAAAIVAIFLVIYFPGVGHGFISDDFRWIVESRVESARDLFALFSSNVGFYRPLTSSSFAADYASWGSNAFGYGVTNLALCLACAMALFALARRLGLPRQAALVAAGVWLLNFHAINMAVLWLSGRTALLAGLFALATALAVLGGRGLLGGVLALCAMLSKEEAVVLPMLFSLFLIIEERRPASLLRVVPMWIALGIYIILRLQSGAFWAADAPSYYQFSFAPAVVGRNVLEYADRAGTVFVAVGLILILATRSAWSAIEEGGKRVLRFAALWIVAMYALTVFLPVRSSLYALLPSLGTALALGAVASAAWRRNPARFARVAIALLVVAVALVPAYRARNARWVRLAELSAGVMRTVAADARDHPPGHVVLVDAPQERFNLTAAFGNLLPEALHLQVGPGWTGEIVALPQERGRAGDLEYRLSSGALEPIRAAR
jgi:hypothetical protein